MNRELLSISGKSKISGSTMPSEPDQPTNIKLKLNFFKIKNEFWLRV